MVTIRREPKYSENNPSQYHFVRHKSHIDSTGIDPRLPTGEQAQTPPKVRNRHTKKKKGNISAMVVR
jgi:hypothetical protein